MTPWYALETDAARQQLYNSPRTVTRIEKPTPKPNTDTSTSAKSIYRSADLVLMELTVRIRKDLDKRVPFEWPDDFYHDLCVEWYEEQKKRGIRDIVYLCGSMVYDVTGRYLGLCMVCWYSDNSVACFFPGQETVNGETKPVIKETAPVRPDYPKPLFADNGSSFKAALQRIADYTDFEWWKSRFKKGLEIMNEEEVAYHGQKDTFDIPQPYFKYLLAVQTTQLGYGMGSWYDLPTMGTEGHKAVTNLFTAEQNKALMYAINNC